MNYKTGTIDFETETQPGFQKRTFAEAFCMTCKEQVDLINFEMAAAMLWIDQDKFFRIAEKGTIHRIHNTAGTVMVCQKSLERKRSQLKTAVIKTEIITLKPLQDNRVLKQSIQF